jgi:hypothetical protein
VGWVCNCHCFGNALILEGTNGVDIGASDEGERVPNAARRSEYSNFWTAAILMRWSMQRVARQCGGAHKRGGAIEMCVI